MMPNSWQLLRSVSICCFEIGSSDRQAAIGRRNVVVGGGDRPLGPADLAAGEAQALERLRAGHFVDQLQVDVQDRLLARLGEHDVVVPDFLEQACAGCEAVPTIVIEQSSSAKRRYNSCRDPRALADGSPEASGAALNCSSPGHLEKSRRLCDGWRPAAESLARGRQFLDFHRGRHST